MNLFNLKDPNNPSGDILKCGLYTLETYGLINDTVALEKLLFNNLKWRTKIQSQNLTDVREAIAVAADSYADKFMN